MNSDDQRLLKDEGQLTPHALYAIAAQLKGSVINRGLLIAVVLVVAEALLMAHYQGASALAILRYTPPVSLFTGVVANLLPLALPLAMMAAFAASVTAWSASKTSTSISLLLATVLMWAASMVFVDEHVRPPVWVFLLLGVLGIAALLLTHTFPLLLVTESGGAALAPVLVALSTVIVIGQIPNRPEVARAISTPFLPAERITMADRHTETAYVLDTSNEWTTLLVESTRQIKIVRSNAVTAREVCSVLGTGTVKPAWAITKSSSAHKPCP